MEPSTSKNLENQINILSAVVRESFASLGEQIGKLHLQLSDLTGRISRIEIVLEDLKEEVLAIGEAVSKDAEVIIRHDTRIGRLEKTVYTA